MKRRILAVLLAACLAFTCSVPAYAEEPAPSVTQEEQTDEEINKTGTEEGTGEETPAADAEETPGEETPAADTEETPGEETSAPDDEAAPAEGEAEAENEEETEAGPEEDTMLLLGMAPGALPVAPAEAPEVSNRVKVMSYNILTTTKTKVNDKESIDYDYTAADGTTTHISRKQLFSDFMNTNLPDSIGLCEVTGMWKNYLKDEFCANSDIYSIAGLKSVNGDTLTSGSGEYSPVIYRSDKFDLENEGGWWFSTTPETPKTKFEVANHQPDSGTSMHFYRVFSFAVLKYKGTDDIAYIHINAHTDHKSDEYVNVLCSKLIKEEADRLRSVYGEVPVVITGDHNCSEFSYSYRYLADSKNGYTDAKYISDVRSNESTFAGFQEAYNPAVNTNNTIDHIYVANGSAGVVYSNVIPNPYFSDHSAIVSEFVLGKENYPSISSISTPDSGARGIDCEEGLALRNLYFETSNDNLTISVNTDSTLFLNGGEVSSTFTLNLSGGENRYSLVAVKGEARTEYTLTAYRTTGEALPVATEVYPAGNVSFMDITNLGGSAMNLSDYEIYYGERKISLANGNKWLRPGETVILLGNSAATVDSFNDAYTADFYASEVLAITGEGIADNSASKIVIKKNGNLVSTSDFSAFNPAALSNKTYKFTLMSGNVVSGLFPYDAEKVTPGTFEEDLGISIKNAYDTIRAAGADILGGGNKVEYDRIASAVDGSYAFYTNVDFGSGNIKSVILNASVKGSNGGGKIELYIDGTYDGQVSEANKIATVLMTETHPSNWTVFENFANVLKKEVKGVHNLTLVFKPDTVAGKTYAANLDTITFTDEQVEEQVIKEKYDPEDARVTVQCELVAKINPGAKKTPNLQASNKVKSSFKDKNGYNMLGTTVNGSSVVYKDIDFGNTGLKGFNFNMAIKNTNCQGTAHVYLYDNETKGEEIARCRVLKTMGVAANYNDYQDVKGELLVSDLTGTHDLLVEFAVDTGNDYFGNLDYFWFDKDLRNPFEKTEAESFDEKAGANTQIEKEFKVSGLKSDSVLIYKNFNFEDATITGMFINASMNADNNGGKADIYISDDGAETLIGTVTFKAVTGQTYNDFRDYEVQLTRKDIVGVHDLIIKTTLGKKLNKDEKAKWVCQIDYFRFEKETSGEEPVADDSKKYTDTFGYLPYMHDAPASVAAGEDYTVTLKYNPLTDGTRVYLYYNKRTAGKTFTKTEMVNTEGNLYSATIPASAITEGGGLTYYFAEEGAKQFADVIYTNSISGYAFQMSDMYYVPIVSDNTPEYPELIITELNAQDKKSNSMEYMVVHNTTGRRVNLRDYTFKRYWYQKGYGNAYTFAGTDPVYIEADSSLVLWKNTGSYTLDDLNTYYYGSALTPDDVVLISGDQFPTTTGYGLTIFKGEKEISSVMWRYTDTYCTDANVKFAPTVKHATVLSVVDNSTDNEAINFRGVTDRGAVEDAARLFELPAGLEPADELPGMTAHGVRILWTKNGGTFKAVFSRGGESLEKTYAADGSDRPRNIFVIGDSITQFYKMPDYPRDGWGAELNRYVNENGIKIRNFGKSGRSTNTFFVEKNFYDMLDEVRPGDVVLIQLCTNDCGTSEGVGVTKEHYQILLGYMFAAILEKDATPVMVESACTHKQTDNGFADQPEIREYNAYAAEVAALYEIPDISLYNVTKTLMETEGYEGMKDIMQYADAYDLRFLDDPAYYTYTDTFTKESKTDKFHYSKYGSEILAKAVMTGVKEKLPELAADIDLSYEPVRLYYRKFSFNGLAATRDSYGATYEGKVKIEYNLGVAPSGTVTVDGEAIESGFEYTYNGNHVLKIYIDENNVNEIPFKVVNGTDKPAPAGETGNGSSAGTGTSSQETGSSVANNEQSDNVQNLQAGNTATQNETPGRVENTPATDNNRDNATDETPAVTPANNETETETNVIKDEDTALSDRIAENKTPENPETTQETGTEEEIADDPAALAAFGEESFNGFWLVVGAIALLCAGAIVIINMRRTREN